MSPRLAGGGWEAAPWEAAGVGDDAAGGLVTLQRITVDDQAVADATGTATIIFPGTGDRVRQVELLAVTNNAAAVPVVLVYVDTVNPRNFRGVIQSVAVAGGSAGMMASTTGPIQVPAYAALIVVALGAAAGSLQTAATQLRLQVPAMTPRAPDGAPAYRHHPLQALEEHLCAKCGGQS